MSEATSPVSPNEPVLSLYDEVRYALREPLTPAELSLRIGEKQEQLWPALVQLEHEKFLSLNDAGVLMRCEQEEKKEEKKMTKKERVRALKQRSRQELDTLDMVKRRLVELHIPRDYFCAQFPGSRSRVLNWIAGTNLIPQVHVDRFASLLQLPKEMLKPITSHVRDFVRDCSDENNAALRFVRRHGLPSVPEEQTAEAELEAASQQAEQQIEKMLDEAQVPTPDRGAELEEYEFPMGIPEEPCRHCDCEDCRPTPEYLLRQYMESVKETASENCYEYALRFDGQGVLYLEELLYTEEMRAAGIIRRNLRGNVIR